MEFYGFIRLICEHTGEEGTILVEGGNLSYILDCLPDEWCVCVRWSNDKGSLELATFSCIEAARKQNAGWTALFRSVDARENGGADAPRV